MTDPEKKALFKAEIEYEKYIEEAMQIIREKLDIIIEYRSKLSKDKIEELNKKLKTSK